MKLDYDAVRQGILNGLALLWPTQHAISEQPEHMRAWLFDTIVSAALIGMTETLIASGASKTPKGALKDMPASWLLNAIAGENPLCTLEEFEASVAQLESEEGAIEVNLDETGTVH